MRKSLLLTFVAALFLVASDALGQGTTTASMRGRVTDMNGEALIGATVRAIHTPTGSEWGNVTDYDGYFRLPALNVGGPYRVTVTYVGFETYEREGIYLSLGQTYNLNVKLSESATELEAVVISAQEGAIIDGNRTGAETFVSQDRINATPTVARAIGDFARFNPQASIEEGNDGLSISIGGMNNRYNAIYIDGAVNNDVFGLAGSGTNGGQTGVSPISIDAIEQFQISVAPFDVRKSGFAGGSINAVTRSGTNEVRGSAYYLYRNQDLAGDTPKEEEQDIEREKLADFTAETYGAWVAGPVIENKLFYFVSAEFQRDETPQPFQIENYNGTYGREDITRLRNYLGNSWDYDPGDFENNPVVLNSDKFLAKIDWNINPNHKLTVRHSYTGAENVEARASDAFGIEFYNGSEYFVSSTNSSALELKSNFNNSMSNHLTIGATLVRDDRDPFGDPFPAIFIDDERGGIVLGSETFSTANLLDQDVITINNNFEYYRGRHTFLAGANVELYRAKNLFIPFNFGDYGWEYSGDELADLGYTSNLDAFINDAPANDYIRSYSLRDNVTGDQSAAGVEFRGALFGFFIQDEFQATDNFKLTLGLRGDIQTFDDTPENADFNDRSRNLLSEFYDLQGAGTGAFIDPQLYFSPRFGFNWDVNGDKSLQVRGGAGIFTSRIPLVWPGGAYNNNGVNRGTVLDFMLSDEQLRLRDWDNQPPGEIDPNNVDPSGDIDIFAEDFRIPQVAKFNLAVDKTLPWGLVGTVEALYNKMLNNVYYQNVNIRPAQGFLTGTPDDRPIFNRRDPVDDTYGRVILASNTNKGYTYNLSGTLTKGFDRGFSGQVSYAYGDAFSIYDGTSSQNSSQWRGLHTVDGRNSFEDLQRSDFSQGHRVIAQLSYRKEYLGFMASQLAVVYEGQSGNPFSYIIGNGQNMTNEDSRNRALAYIPASADQINLVEVDGVSAAQQWETLNEFIENDPYLSENRGDYAERNASRTPFEGVIDLRFLQDFYLEMANGKRNTLQLSIDVFNFTNLINPDWGKRYFATDIELYEFEGFEDDGSTPRFSFRPFNDEQPNEPFFGNLDDRGIVSSRWQMQVGVRYRFN